MSAPSVPMIDCPNRWCENEMPAARLEIDGTNGVCGTCSNDIIAAKHAQARAMEAFPMPSNGFGANARS